MHKYIRKIKRKTIKSESKSEYASRARPNGPRNIYVAGMERQYDLVCYRMVPFLMTLSDLEWLRKYSVARSVSARGLSFLWCK